MLSTPAACTRAEDPTKGERRQEIMNGRGEGGKQRCLQERQT